MKLKTFEDTNYQIQEERGDTIADPTEIKREYYKQQKGNIISNFVPTNYTISMKGANSLKDANS